MDYKSKQFDTEGSIEVEAKDDKGNVNNLKNMKNGPEESKQA